MFVSVGVLFLLVLLWKADEINEELRIEPFAFYFLWVIGGLAFGFPLVYVFGSAIGIFLFKRISGSLSHAFRTIKAFIAFVFH